ncbi:MAG: PBP1A family penicillin-binding protein [Burkholderiales bacterium]|nr:PBP1A family penicillin-binding protein [Burkholderiales bacterium]
MTARPWRGLAARLLLGGLALVLAALLALAAAAAWYWRELPPLDKAIDYRPRQHMQVLTADGLVIAEFGAERRVFVPIAKIPIRLRDAVLSVEDADFYHHGAISWHGVARALVADLTGGMPQGASTITQQVARTFFLSTERTPERKIKEALLAYQLEQRLTKNQILERYMNQIYLGEHAYGFGAAADVYFGKSLDALTVAEAAMLAGLPQNPANANPLASPERARKRQLWVLWRMRATGDIDAATYRKAVAEKLVLKSPLFVDVNAQHVAEMARRAAVALLGDQAYTDGVRVVTTLRAADQRAAHAALRRAVLAHEATLPWRGPEDQLSLPADPVQAERAAALALKDLRDDADLRVAVVLAASPRRLVAELASGRIVSVTGPSLQRVGAALRPGAPPSLAIRRGAVVRLLAVTPPAHAPPPARRARARPRAPAPRPPQWALAQWPQTEAAFVALDPDTGRVRALVGGFDFNHDQFNHVTSAQRQPGSTIKPFLVSAAFESGVMPETLVNDAPLPPLPGEPADWHPHDDDDDQYEGMMTVRRALVESKNMVAIRLLQHVGLAAARAWIGRFGFDLSRQPDDLTLALGSGSVTPLELALGYAVLANGGHRVTPVLIDRITDAQGRVLFQAPPPAPLTEANRVVPARNVFLVDSLLADVTRSGTAAAAQQALQRPDLYGKTGTTNDGVDAWFAGFAPGVVAVAWMGYDQPASLGPGATGAALALPIWIDTLREMLQGVPVQPPIDLTPPPGIVAAGDDWRYAEWADNGLAALDDPTPAAAAAAASAASAPAPAAPVAPVAPVAPASAPAPAPVATGDLAALAALAAVPSTPRQ